jgi:hypothetical protein
MRCRWCDNLDELLTEASGPARRGLQLSVLFAKYFNSSSFCGLATPRWPQCLDLPKGET